MRKLCCWVFLEEKFFKGFEEYHRAFARFPQSQGGCRRWNETKSSRNQSWTKFPFPWLKAQEMALLWWQAEQLKRWLSWGFLKSNLRGEMFDLLSSPAATGAATQLPFLLWPLWIIFAKHPFSSFMNYRSSHPAMRKNMLERKNSANLISKKSGENCLLWCFFIPFFLSSE